VRGGTHEVVPGLGFQVDEVVAYRARGRMFGGSTAAVPWFRVGRSGFRVWGLGLKVECSGFRVRGLGMRVQASGLRVGGLGLRVECSGFRV